jgi:hypothetical protein
MFCFSLVVVMNKAMETERVKQIGFTQDKAAEVVIIEDDEDDY